jgi:hypothetical protein
MALVGLAVFFHGTLYWGQFYLMGLLFFAIAASFPLVPMKFWPGVYGLVVGVAQVLAGCHIRQVHRAATARVSGPPTS